MKQLLFSTLLLFPTLCHADGLEDAIARHNTPKKVWLFLQQEVKYTSDQYSPEKRDYLQPARVTLQRKRGDCEDLAHLAATLLEGNQYEVCRIVAHQKNNLEDGHAFCVVREDKRWSVLSIEEGKSTTYSRNKYETGYSSIQNIVHDIQPAWGMYGFFVEDQAKKSGMRYTEIWYRNKDQWTFFTDDDNPPGADFTAREDVLVHILHVKQ